MNAYQCPCCIKALGDSMELPLGGHVSLKAFRCSRILAALPLSTLDGAEELDATRHWGWGHSGRNKRHRIFIHREL